MVDGVLSFCLSLLFVCFYCYGLVWFGIGCILMYGL